jgi:hypothetical protein
MIDLQAWNKAKWAATFYIYGSDPRMPPAMVLGFKEPEAGKAIFSEWRRQLGSTDSAERIRVAIFTGIDKGNPAHYKIVIGSNIADWESGAVTNQQFIMISRINRMAPPDTRNLDAFIKSFNLVGFYYLMPGHFRDLSIKPQIFHEFAIRKRQIVVRPIWKVDENDPDLAAIDLDDTPFIPDGIDDIPILRALEQKRRFRSG